jgi:hypothetical protein
MTANYRRQYSDFIFHAFKKLLIVIQLITLGASSLPIIMTESECRASPTTPIQSAGIRSSVSTELSGYVFFKEFSYKCSINDSIISSVDPLFIYPRGGLFLQIGNRVEVGGFPGFLLFINLWDIRVKVNLFSFGRPLMFQNLSASISLNTSGDFNISADNSFTNASAGLVLGTSHAWKNHMIEWVIIPGGCYNHERYDPQGPVYFAYSSKIYSFTIGTGAILDLNKVISIVAGGSYFIPLKTDNIFSFDEFKNDSLSTRTFKYYNFTNIPKAYFQVGMIFNIAKKRVSHSKNEKLYMGRV